MVKPVVLIIMDGWGIASAGPGNAIALANTPFYDRFWAVYPKTQLAASGESVGLPRGEDGNSETGHLNLGAGQIVYQDLPRIDMMIADGSFFEIPAFKAAAEYVRKNNTRLHLLGLIGAGGVHSSMRHLFALLKFAQNEKLENVYLHLFTDGRDSAPNSALIYIARAEQEMEKSGLGKIATLCGRYFAMDRDYRWNRTQRAYELMVQGKGNHAPTAQQAVELAYQGGKTDEFIDPAVIDKKGLIRDYDAAIFFNFRIDRPRQLTKAFILPSFETLKIEKSAFDPYAEKYGLRQYQIPGTTTTFQREEVLEGLFFVTMTEYEKGLPVAVAVPPEVVKLPLGRVLSEKGLRQLRISETEKERFVGYYFNGGREDAFPGEDRVEIPSPKVATYDLKPEMSALGITSELTKRLESNMYDFVVVNYANPDMVGHTGVLQAGVKACEVVDRCVGELTSLVTSLGGAAVITADHGNVEEMINLQTGEVDTEHSTNPVPFIIVDQKQTSVQGSGRNLRRGILGDVAPTLLALMGIEKPSLLTGRNLLE